MSKIYKPQNELGNTLVDITKVGYNSDNSFNADFVSIENEINSEETARIAADTTLQENIDNETTRAQAAETTLQSNIEAETTRATGKETELDGKISAEVSRAQEAEEALQSNIDGEVNRATAAETQLQTNIDNEVTRASEKENELNISITAEVQRAQAAETTLQENISAEETRALAAEGELNTRITDLESTSIKAVSVDNFINENTANNTVTLSLNVSTGNIDSSISAAAEDSDGTKTLSTVRDTNAAIAAEKTRAELAESTIEQNISNLSNNLNEHTNDTNAHMSTSDREKFELLYDYVFPKIKVYNVTDNGIGGTAEIGEERMPNEDGNFIIQVSYMIPLALGFTSESYEESISGNPWLTTSSFSSTLPETIKNGFKVNIVQRNYTTYEKRAEYELTAPGRTSKLIFTLPGIPVSFQNLNNVTSTVTGGEQSIVFSCNSPEDGSVVSDTDWCTANIEKTGSASDSGGVTFTESKLILNITENSTGAERVANVTVTIQGTPKTITVTQAGS